MGNRFLVLIIAVSFALFIFIAALSYKVISGPHDDIGARPALPMVKSPDEAALSAAASYEEAGDLLKSRDAYQEMIEKFPNSRNIQKAQEALWDLNIKILFSPSLTQNFSLYEVKKGDTVSGLAKRFNTTTDLIERMNGLKGSVIVVGERLKIPKSRFSIVVDKSQHTLTLKSEDEIVKTYNVATGKDSSTPIGNFKITNKIVDPPWYPPAGGVIKAGDPKNVLGSRWLGISKAGYGIHGTTEPESIGRSVTEGCVRMKNSDVEELFAIVPEGTEVVIID